MTARTNLANEEAVAPGIRQARKDSHCFLVAMQHETVSNSQCWHTIRKTQRSAYQTVLRAPLVVREEI